MPSDSTTTQSCLHRVTGRVGMSTTDVFSQDEWHHRQLAGWLPLIRSMSS